MRFEVDKDRFVEGLGKTVPVTEKRSTLPILSHVLVDARDNILSLTANDLEIGVRVLIDCTVHESGTITAPGKKLLEIARELPSGTVTVRLTESGRIGIASGAYSVDLAGLDAADYPALPEMEEIKTVPVGADRLLIMIDKTIFASSNDDSRFNLNSVLFEKTDKGTRLVATDGHRLALIDESVEIPIASRTLVPKKGLAEVRRLLEAFKGEVAIGFDQKNLLLKSERFMMTVRLIDGDYPDYMKVIPKSAGTALKSNKAGLLQTLRRVGVLTSDRNKGVDFQVVPGKLEISANHPDLGTAKDAIDVEYEGVEFQAIINVDYLKEALSVMETEDVNVEYHKESAPIVIYPVPSGNYFNLVMPMRK